MKYSGNAYEYPQLEILEPNNSELLIEPREKSLTILWLSYTSIYICYFVLR